MLLYATLWPIDNPCGTLISDQPNRKSLREIHITTDIISMAFSHFREVIYLRPPSRRLSFISHTFTLETVQFNHRQLLSAGERPCSRALRQQLAWKHFLLAFFKLFGGFKPRTFYSAPAQI